jgi:hypothetical protein
LYGVVLGVRPESEKGSSALEALSETEPCARVVVPILTVMESWAEVLAESVIGLALAMLVLVTGVSMMNAAGEDASDARYGLKAGAQRKARRGVEEDEGKGNWPLGGTIGSVLR